MEQISQAPFLQRHSILRRNYRGRDDKNQIGRLSIGFQWKGSTRILFRAEIFACPSSAVYSKHVLVREYTKRLETEPSSSSPFPSETLFCVNRSTWKDRSSSGICRASHSPLHAVPKAISHQPVGNFPINSLLQSRPFLSKGHGETYVCARDITWSTLP